MPPPQLPVDGKPADVARLVHFGEEGLLLLCGDSTNADRAADDDVHAVELIEKILHDDLAEFLYKRLRRRPMILPVVVEV